jgi:hypothetical protein
MEKSKTRKTYQVCLVALPTGYDTEISNLWGRCATQLPEKSFLNTIGDKKQNIRCIKNEKNEKMKNEKTENTVQYPTTDEGICMQFKREANYKGLWIVKNSS